MHASENSTGSPSLRSALSSAVQGLPDDAHLSLPVGWLREKLNEDPPESFSADLTVKKAGELLDRHHTTVAAWCRQGRISQAYKMNGREWRIPPAALEAFQRQLRNGDGDRSPRPSTNGREADLSAWREHADASP